MEDEGFHMKEKLNSVEFLRFVLQYSKSATTLQNEVKCYYHLHNSKPLDGWKSMAISDSVVWLTVCHGGTPKLV